MIVPVHRDSRLHLQDLDVQSSAVSTAVMPRTVGSASTVVLPRSDGMSASVRQHYRRHGHLRTAGTMKYPSKTTKTQRERRCGRR
jgi:hypothetical protein